MDHCEDVSALQSPAEKSREVKTLLEENGVALPDANVWATASSELSRALKMTASITSKLCAAISGATYVASLHPMKIIFESIWVQGRC